MKSKILFAFIGVILSITITGVASEGANPFNPIFSSSSGGATDAYVDGASAQGKHVLQQHPVKNYILMGSISSDSGQIALIRARNGEEYFVRLNDLLGSADGKIIKISGAGIEVSEKDKIVSLSVRNRSTSNEKTE